MLTKDKGEGNFSADVKLTQLRIKSNHRGRVYKSLYYSLDSKCINSLVVSYGYFWYRLSFGLFKYFRDIRIIAAFYQWWREHSVKKFQAFWKLKNRKKYKLNLLKYSINEEVLFVL